MCKDTHGQSSETDPLSASRVAQQLVTLLQASLSSSTSTVTVTCTKKKTHKKHNPDGVFCLFGTNAVRIPVPNGNGPCLVLRSVGPALAAPAGSLRDWPAGTPEEPKKAAHNYGHRARNRFARRLRSLLVAVVSWNPGTNDKPIASGVVPPRPLAARSEAKRKIRSVEKWPCPACFCVACARRCVMMQCCPNSRRQPPAVV